MMTAYPTPDLYPGQMWEDRDGNIRQVFSVWRGMVTYGFVKAMGGEFGSDACSEGVFRSRYAHIFKSSNESIEDYLLNLSKAAIMEVVDKYKSLGEMPPHMRVNPDYPIHI